MRNQKAGWLLAVLLLFIVAGGFGFFKKDRNISIAVTENKNEISLVAEFPDEKSKQVQDQVIRHLELQDLRDLRHLEIKHYQTPDRLMRIHIKSKPGYLKLRMRKDENNMDAQSKLKQTSDVIGRALRD